MARDLQRRDERVVLGRRGFLAAGVGAFLCTIGGERVELARPGDAAKADAAAARVPRPRARAAAGAPVPTGPTEALTFGTPEPQPGGTVREYWIAARDLRWDAIPSRPRRDQWHGRALRGPSAFRAFAYQEYTPGFAAPKRRPAIPGPTLVGEVGDVIRVHFRNALSDRFPQALTMHPHGVRYTPDYDGVYLGDFTRAGGFIAPGEEFTYTWECTPDSVGAWPYHDHGPNHTLNTFRGLFGALVVRERGERPPDVEVPLFLHSLLPPVTGLPAAYQCINGRAYAGNTPTITAKVGQDVALHVFGMDNAFHDFHIHGHRWRDGAGRFVDTPAVGPNETVTVRFVEDNPGRWLYHCHVFAHQDAGMAGWYLVTP
jgi:FtsP/CotA-like multicopper oxidase with cupredoxin domain